MYTDGASKGNPGKAGAGAVAFEGGQLLFEVSEALGVQTNNYAEYMAAILALQKLLDLGKSNAKITVHADSKLLVEQINGNWKVKNENIKPLFKELQKLKAKFTDLNFVHVPRNLNAHADALANKAILDL